MENLEIVNCKNISIRYELDDSIDSKGGVVFIVESKDVSKIVLSLIETIDSLGVTSWGLQSGEEYANIKSNCATSEIINDYVINDINSIKSRLQRL